MAVRTVSYIIVTVAAALLAAGCVSRALEMEQQVDTVTTADGISVSVDALQKGRVRIYVSEETAARLEEDPTFFIRENPEMGITGICRTFPYEEEFEMRTRSRGLHRWWNVEFDKTTPLTRAGKGLGSVAGVTKVEYCPLIVRPKGQSVGWRHASSAAYAQLRVNQSHRSKSRSGSVNLPFDDPGLEGQWHYFNRLEADGAVAGCDVNVVPAWNAYRPGDENIIVAIVDGGIEYTHDDLAANMWHNPAQSGKLIYGYNFLDNSYIITAEDHGTHVAGTIAAVNNNATGGCGIAGGDAKAAVPGVRLMSCQIFKQGSDDSGDEIRAIKWAADHGAVLCQNSWGYEEDVNFLPEVVKDAIDYFNEHAGCDAQGNQTGPMRGGLVVFAAGNESTRGPVYPAAYPGVLAVSALDADFKITAYSNYGDWVDLAAPGGDKFEIYSTVIGNSYDWYSGTSMASPHVTGAAALVLANCGGPGFTRENLFDILLHHTTDISAYNPRKYPGIGLVNVCDAIRSDTGQPQFEISSFNAAASGFRVKATISATPLSPAANDWVSAAVIYYSETPFTSTDGIPYTVCSIRSGISDAPFEVEAELPCYDTRYYIAAALQDEYGHLTPNTAVTRIVTAENLPPVISGDTEHLTVKAHETITLEFGIGDPYGDVVTASLLSTNGNAVKMTQQADRAIVSIRGYASKAGSFDFTLSATDTYGLTSSVTLTYDVLENHAPQLVGPISDIIVDDNSAVTLNLDDYFADADGEALTYDIKVDKNSIVKPECEASTLRLIPQQYGYANITVSATDFFGKSVGSAFSMLICDGSHQVELYPNPVTQGKLYLRTKEKATVDVVITNAAGGTLLNQSFSAAPFSPAVIDISDFAAGVYDVTTVTATETLDRKIVKL